MSVVQKRVIKAHNKLLLDVIKRQAGTLDKGILECVMNSIEAGATRVDIELNQKMVDEQLKSILSIVDDGRGIENIDEIEKFFETFGTPHKESENKIWAQFRIGRGQIFSRGFNIWTTSQFKMSVDIEKWGLSYELETELPEYNGCDIKVELYENPIGSWPYYSENSLIEAITKQVEFMSIPIFFNGEQINTPPETLKWTFEDELAYYHFGIGTDVAIYNLGAYVMKIPASQAGTTGVIVSKKQLKVNFARNDVQSDCPIYKDIQEIVVANRIKKSRNYKRRLHDHERQAILTDLRDEIQSYEDVSKIGLIRNASGKYISLDNIRKNKQPWTFSPPGSRLADTIMQQGKALCLDEGVLTELNYHGEEKDFFNWLVNYDVLYNRGRMSRKVYNSWTVQPKLFINHASNNSGRKSLQDGFSDELIDLPQEKWTTPEKRVVAVLEEFNCWKGRVIKIGLGDIADAWTDGNTYITIERSFLKRLSLESGGGTAKLMAVLIHEVAHDDDTTNTHIHSEEFYRNFHDLCVGVQFSSVLSFLPSFYAKMKASRISEKFDKQMRKEVKEKMKRQEKLGIAASSENTDDISF